LSLIAEYSSLLFVVQSNQLVEHVSSRSGGLGILHHTKNTRLPGFINISLESIGCSVLRITS